MSVQASYARAIFSMISADGENVWNGSKARRLARRTSPVFRLRVEGRGTAAACFGNTNSSSFRVLLLLAIVVAFGERDHEIDIVRIFVSALPKSTIFATRYAYEPASIARARSIPRAGEPPR